jgi:Ca2+-binding RTX toxin-like protein
MRLEGGRMTKRVATLVAAVVLALPLMAGPAIAAPFTGLVSPTIFGGLADLNGSGNITSADSWTAFYGDTDIIGGGLDCDAWATVNDGADGDGVIDSADDCTLVGFDGTANGVTITVSNGHFVEADGVSIANGFKLPTTFNAGDPDNPSVVAADFGWQVIAGRVDTNGDGVIDGDDCSVDIVNGWDILGPACGFNPATPTVDAGLIDTNGSFTITTADDSASGFFGLAVADGFVQAVPVVALPTITSISPSSAAPGASVTITGTNLSGAQVTVCNTAATETVVSATSVTFTVPTVAAGTCAVVVTTPGGTVSTTMTVLAVTPPPTACTITGTAGPDTLTGTPGDDVICGKAGSDQIRGKQGNDVLRGAKGADLIKGGKGNDLLQGGKGADNLNGGPGFDTCKGGKGSDIVQNCEA